MGRWPVLTRLGGVDDVLVGVMVLYHEIHLAVTLQEELVDLLEDCDLALAASLPEVDDLLVVAFRGLAVRLFDLLGLSWLAGRGRSGGKTRHIDV